MRYQSGRIDGKRGIVSPYPPPPSSPNAITISTGRTDSRYNIVISSDGEDSDRMEDIDLQMLSQRQNVLLVTVNTFV